MNLRRFIYASALLLSVTAVAADGDIFQGVPPAPEGYATYDDVKTAVMSGKVEIIKPPTLPEDIEAHKDVVYAERDSGPLKLDVYVPKTVEEPQPCIIFVHGGGWSKGNKGDYIFYNVHFAKLGYVTASISYRFAPDHHWPDQYQDETCAIRYLVDHAAEYKIDPTKIALVGGSAGGHLVLMAAYGEGIPMDCPGATEATPVPISCVVNFYGVTDCTPPGVNSAREITRLIGKPYSEAADIYAQASPITFVRPGVPPTLTFHGTVDELVPLDQSERLHAALDKAGVDNYYDPVSGWPHTMDIVEGVNAHCRAVMENFFAKYLR